MRQGHPNIPWVELIYSVTVQQLLGHFLPICIGRKYLQLIYFGLSQTGRTFISENKLPRMVGLIEFLSAEIRL